MANNNEILLAKMAEMLQQVVGTPASSEPVLSDFEIGLRKFFEEFGQPVGSALYIAERALKQASRNEQYDKELQANVLEKASEIKIIREERKAKLSLLSKKADNHPGVTAQALPKKPAVEYQEVIKPTVDSTGKVAGA
tara:strand:+ start:358 stop:771 length:414 start_codon:yes stop_codon:yes gene_type:complete